MTEAKDLRGSFPLNPNHTMLLKLLQTLFSAFFILPFFHTYLIKRLKLHRAARQSVVDDNNDPKKKKKDLRGMKSCR